MTLRKDGRFAPKVGKARFVENFTNPNLGNGTSAGGSTGTQA
jgi:hypothetical protein